MLKQKFTDAELLAIDLDVTDAYAQGGLTLKKLPEGVTIVRAIHMYRHARYPGQKVFCCVCGSQLHQVGQRVACSDGRETLLGNCCAKREPEITTVNAIAVLKDLKERKKYVLKLHKLKSTALRMVAQLDKWQKLGDDLRDKQCEFHRVFPAAYQLINQAAKRDGNLSAGKRVRKVEWQNRRDQKDAKDEWDHILVNHLIRGRFFLQESEPHELTNIAMRALWKFSKVADETDKHSTLVLKNTWLGLRRAVEGLSKLDEMRAAVPLFFGSENLAGIVHWAKLLRTGHDRQSVEDIGVQGDALVNWTTGKSVSAPELLMPDAEVVLAFAMS